VHSSVALVAAMALYLAGMGMALPQAQAGALLPFPDRAGAASSLLGFITQILSAVVGAIIGHVLTTSAWPLAVAMVRAGGLSLLLWLSSRQSRSV
jgi:DHA1 family bicyclomycin/chloramphenicol resistance-like MFS transporter